MTRPRDLRYSLDVYDARGNWVERLGELDDLDPARAAFASLCAKYPDKLIFMRERARVIARSDEPPDWLAAYRPIPVFRENPVPKQPFPIIREGDAPPPQGRPQDPHLDGRDLKFETLEHGGAEPDTMPNAIRATDPQGRAAIYVRKP